MKKREKAKKIAEISDKFKDIMILLGLDLSDPSLADTPLRVAKMYVNEICGRTTGISVMPKMTTFPNNEKFGDISQVVLIKNVIFYSICEHHFVPFHGKVHIAYLPDTEVVGLSKPVRLVQHLAAKPQVQERLTQEIAQNLCEILKTQDVAVIVEASHLCCSMRGAKDPNALTRTSFLSGAFRESPLIRQEFFNLIQIP